MGVDDAAIGRMDDQHDCGRQRFAFDPFSNIGRKNGDHFFPSFPPIIFRRFKGKTAVRFYYLPIISVTYSRDSRGRRDESRWYSAPNPISHLMPVSRPPLFFRIFVCDLNDLVDRPYLQCTSDIHTSCHGRLIKQDSLCSRRWDRRRAGWGSGQGVQHRCLCVCFPCTYIVL